MAKKILLGAEFFEKIINNNGYYVDKTELIYNLVEETSNDVTLFTRPRRFGKTLTMTTLEVFFDVRCDSRELFKGLNITKNHPEFCDEWMNQYPTLFISLKDVEGLTFDEAYANLKNAIADLCKKHASIEFNEKVLPSDSELFHNLQYEKTETVHVKSSLKTIMRMMKAVYGKPVILLIDEYDVPLAKANENGYYKEMLDVIRGMMSVSLKTNEYLKFAVVTGCLRIPKESIFTGVNNFASYSVLDTKFTEYFGFTEDEMEELLHYYGRADKLDMVKAWYDGYVIGNSHIYCPWDAMSYVSELKDREDAKPMSYWENTSGNGAIKEFFELENVDVDSKFEALLNGNTIWERVTNTLTYEDAYSTEQNLWSVLLMTGYLTAVGMGESDNEGNEALMEVELRIPNREIAGIFRKAVVDHFNRTVDSGSIKELMQALWDGNDEKASGIMSDLLWHTISYNDYHEDYYHAFVTGIFVGRSAYAVESNKEQGLGRPDINLRDNKNRRAMIIEAKISESENRMEYWCDEAIKQIQTEEYAKNMDGYKLVRCYGVSFFKKKARVKLMK